MKRFLTIAPVLLGFTILSTQFSFGQRYDFNDGTLQGWTMSGAFDEAGNGPYAHNFIPGWTSQVNYPSPNPGAGHGALQLYADGGHGISGSSGALWVIELHSPDLSSDADWQGSSGYRVHFVENMGVRFPVYANLWVTVRDMNSGNEWALWRGANEELNHSNSYDGDAVWDVLDFDLSQLPAAFDDYRIEDIYVTISGSMSGIFDGPVAIDEVLSLGPSTAPRIHVDVPNGREVWDAGSLRLIRWNTRNYTGDVKISMVHGGVPHVITPATTNDGTYEWTLPTQRIENVKIQIEDASDGDPVDISDEVFQIVAPTASITVDVPNGGEVWEAGSTRYIRWHSQGFDGPVAIEYSIDNGTTYQGIISAAENNGTYEWVVPNTPSSNAVVKISDSSTRDIADTSDGTFTIVGLPPAFTVQAPNGGEIWEAGSTQSIRWSTANYQGEIGIEYSTDAGGTYTNIAAVTADDGIYDWTIPETPTERGLVRVYNPENPSTNDVSDAHFAISSPAQPTITVASPNGGEEYAVGSSETITWSSQDFQGSVRIEYSGNGGASYDDIVASTPNTGSYGWTVPSTTTGQALIRISDAADGDPFDTSDAVFSVVEQAQPVITVLTPNGGEEYAVGSQETITWSSQNFEGSVRIEYSGNGGAGYDDIVASTPNTGSYGWTVPSTTTGQALIRISDSADGDPFDTSDAVFSVVEQARPEITVTSPNGGERWEMGTSQNITWTTRDFDGSVRIEYSGNGGGAFDDVVASTPNTGTYGWAVPATRTDQALIRISDAADGDPSDTSDEFFAIIEPAQPTLVVVSPNGGESWQAGSVQTVRWSSENFSAPVRVEISTDGGATFTNIAASTANTGSLGWVVSNTPTTQALIRISDAADGNPTDTSDDVFTIVPQQQQSITLSVPNGGESWAVGTSQTITWQSEGLGRVHIEYSTNAGTTYSDIAVGAPDIGTYDWVIPNTPTTEALVRVSDAADGDPSDASDAVFTIAAQAVPQITVVSPNGGESWAEGTAQSITWTSQDFGDPVRIEYSVDAGTTYQTIVGSSPNTGTYAWLVPNTATSQAMVRVSDAADGDPSDASDAVFTIVAQAVPQITVVSPNGGETWTEGTAQSIRWTSESFSGAVHIQYSTDAGATYTTIVASTPNAGSYAWLVPGAPTTQGLVRISDAADGDPFDVSDAFFSIEALPQPTITVTVPNGGESWTRGDRNTIRWESSNFDGPVRIDVTDDGGVTYSLIAASVDNTGWHRWTVDAQASSNCLVRVSDAADGDPFDLSDGEFSVVSGVGIVSDLPIPKKFAIHQNYPNPFRSQTAIRYDVPKPGPVELAIFDIAGREVRVLASGHHQAGVHEAVFAVRDLPAGVYFARLQSGNFVGVRRVTILR